MKKFAGTVAWMLLAGSVFALTPEQAGIYVGTLTITSTDLNTKKTNAGNSASVIMNVQLDGTAEIVAEDDNGYIPGKLVRGTYSAGFLSDEPFINGPLQVIGPAKGNKLKLSQSLNVIAPPNDGGTLTISLKLKRSKIQ